MRPPDTTVDETALKKVNSIERCWEHGLQLLLLTPLVQSAVRNSYAVRELIDLYFIQQIRSDRNQITDQRQEKKQMYECSHWGHICIYLKFHVFYCHSINFTPLLNVHLQTGNHIKECVWCRPRMPGIEWPLAISTTITRVNVIFCFQSWQQPFLNSREWASTNPDVKLNRFTRQKIWLRKILSPGAIRNKLRRVGQV